MRGLPEEQKQVANSEYCVMHARVQCACLCHDIDNA